MQNTQIYWSFLKKEKTKFSSKTNVMQRKLKNIGYNQKNSSNKQQKMGHMNGSLKHKFKNQNLFEMV